MEYEVLLRALGNNENEIRKWEDIFKSLWRLSIMLMLLINIPLIILFGSWGIISTDLLLFILIILIVPIEFYIIKKQDMYSKEFEDMNVKRWLPNPNEYILKTPLFVYYPLIVASQVFIIFFIQWIIFGYLVILFIGFLSLLVSLVLVYAKLSNVKSGVSIRRRVKADTDEIADKISMALNFEKKLVVKSKANRTYSIDIPQYSLTVRVSRDTYKKEWTNISIRGVKEENLNHAKQIMKKIDSKIFQEISMPNPSESYK